MAGQDILMGLTQAKHARSFDYIYNKKRASLSIFLSTILLTAIISPVSLALDTNTSSISIPALCDPSLLPPQTIVSPSPEPTLSEPETQVIPAAELSATVSTTENSPKVVCPSPVTNVFVRPQNTQLEISWTPGISSEANTVENITDYYIKVLDTAQVIKVSADRTSTTISGLTNGTSYSIIVYAASEYGSSMASDLVTAIPLSGNEGEVAGLIVAFKPEANVEQGQVDVPGQELVSQVELTIENRITEDVHVVEFSEATTLEEAKSIANEISQDPQVVWAEPDQFFYTAANQVINDPNYSTDQWNLWDRFGIGIGQSNTEMTSAWSLTAGQGITVAVIDTGITSHPDLDSQLVKGFDFVSDPEFLKASREENGPQVSFDGDYIDSEKYGALGWDDNPLDPGDWRGVGPVRNSTWHGTHIAGVIAAQSENQEGIAGIAPGAKIQPIRALSWRGGLLSDIASSITWASGGSVTGVADNPTPAKVINMSFSVNSICPTTLQTAINDAFARGSVLVAAAGNNNDDVKNYAPANCENVISVGASNKDGKRASYSNYGLGLDVSAPGGDANDNGIYSTANTGLTEPASFGYASQQGTSISAAHVSAIAARIFSANPTFNPTDVKNQITSKESVREFADTQCDINSDIYCGEGIVSLFQVAAACEPTSQTANGYTTLTFTNTGSCNWSIPAGVTEAKVLVVGGGGAGGGGIGGGGGAGEFIETTRTGLTGGSSVLISVGAGGLPKRNAAGNIGGDSQFDSVIAYGGGGGGTNTANPSLASSGPNLGSQGGGGYDHVAKTVGTRSDVTGYRNNGGSGSLGGSGDATAGGGGGAGGAGVAGTTSSGSPAQTGGAGGPGRSSSISGLSTFYAAGGGGGVNGATETADGSTPASSGLPGEGGSGIGGSGGAKANASGNFGNRGDGTGGTVNANGTAGATNTGSGGGGASNWEFGGAGGSGIVIVSYLSPPTIESATITGTQKIGNTLTATAGSTTGTITDTSYKWQVSDDGSTGWTDISGATANQFTISGTTYRGKYLRAAITVINSGGTATVESSATSQIYYQDCSPSTTTPTINGVVRNVYSFTNTGTCDWTIPDGVTAVDVLVVGGGGGGGGTGGRGWSGGGGAGGQVVSSPNKTVTSQSNVVIQVGDGGAGGSATGNSLDSDFPQNGQNSSFGDGDVEARGGGAGGHALEGTDYGTTARSAPKDGGGGGAAGGWFVGAAYSWNPGFKGGDGFPSNDSDYQAAGGGAGSGGNGFTATSAKGGAGGVGVSNSYSGSSIFYGGGGGGGKRTATTGTAGSGGSGGGGGGGRDANGGDGTPNRGGGGGGGGGHASAGKFGGRGGSGLVIVSTVAASPTITAITPSTGSVTAGGEVTITGTNFVSGQTTVTINGVSLTSVIVNADGTSMTAILPNLTVGTHDLVVNNGGGTATSVGAFTALAAPTIASATITGNTVVGETLTATANSVTGTSVTTTYQWQSATTSNGSYSNISGATNSTYILTSGEATKFIKVIITVANAGGNASATSSATTVVYTACSPTPTTTEVNGVNRNVYSFTTIGTCSWTIPDGVTAVDVLVVGGGGGGGGTGGRNWSGGGGAGGQVVSSLNKTVTSQSNVVIRVGDGGAGGSATHRLLDSHFPQNGQNSSFGDGDVIARGGGAGGHAYVEDYSINDRGAPKNGGGGGAQGGRFVGAAYLWNLDLKGGDGRLEGNIDFQAAGGGAGSGGSGVPATFSTSGGVGGAGGLGVSNSFSGGPKFYGGGGGGGKRTSTGGPAGSGGSGVGGDGGMGADDGTGADGGNGIVNTGGGGGGGGGLGGSGGGGGSGIVVVAYASAPTVSAISPTLGAIAGDVSVTITGTNFIAGSTVTIGGVSLTNVSVVSGTSITGTITANSLTTGFKDVVVTTTSGTSTGGTGLYEAVSKTTPTLTGFSDTSALFSEATKALTAPSVSDSIAGSFTYSSSDTDVASFASDSTPTATLVGVGTAIITATFTPSDLDLYNSTTTTLTLTVSQGNQSTLTVTSTSGTFGSALTLTTSGGDGDGAVTYVATTGTASSCTVSGTSLTAGSAGTCLVTATKAADTNYLVKSSTQTTVTFAQAAQSTLTVTSTSGTFGSALTLTTSGGDGDGAVTYVATPGTATSCSISGTTLTAGSGGTCLVTATKAASTNFNAISSSQTTITFAQRTIVLSNFADISNKTYGDSTFTLTAPTVAGGVAGSFAYTSGTTATATISGSTVTIIGAGTSTITATFTPTDTASYENQTITMLLTINKKAITVTAEDKTKIFGESTPVNTFTNSTLVGSDAISSLTFTYSGTNTTTAPTSVGNYTITPSSATFSTGSTNNYTITYVPSAYSITKATPTFTGFNNVSKTFGDSSFIITAPTVTGSIAGTFTYSSSDTSAVTISSATATVAGSGSSLITATFTPTDTTNYNSATTTMTISVAKATQSALSINSASSVNYGSTLALTSTGGSGTGALSFAVTSGTCSISSTTLTPGDAGSTCIIQVTKAADSNYNVATSSTQTITINKINQTVSFTSTAPSSPVSGDTYRPLATSSSGAIPTISIDATSSSVCSLSAGIVTFNTSGTCLIEADSASSTNYNAASTASQSITVAKIAQTITFAEPSGSNFGDSNRTMSATASSGLAIAYSRGASTTNTACEVSSSGVVTILAVGNCQVTASQSGNDQYDSALAVSRTFAVSAVVPSAPFLTSVSAGNTSATVSFTTPTSNGGATLSAYEVVAMPSSGSNVTKSDCSTSASPLACTITGLTNGTSYTFKVAAINSAGTSAYSTTSGSFTPATIANAVVNLVAQPGDGTLIVNWDQPTNLGGGSFTRYDVYYKSTGSYDLSPNAQINSVSTTTQTFSGLINGTSYDVKVVAITSVNASELTGNTAEVSQYPSTVPSAPTNVTVSKLTGTSARISWGLPLSDGGASLDATTPYVATITGGPSPITCGVLDGRSCDITGLSPATTYSVSVVAQNRMGAGTAGTATYLVPSNDANLLSFNLKTGPNLSALSDTNFAPTFNSNTTIYSVSVANTDFYTSITPTVNELTATIKINGVTVASGAARNLSLGIGSNVFTVEVTAGDLTTTKTYTLTVTRPKALQMPISITSAGSVNYGDTITLTTTGGSGSGLVSFTTTGTCTTAFSGGNHILTPGDVGSSCSIVATKATDDDYFSASTSSQSITINKTTPTLSGFGNISKTYGDPTFTINEPSVAGSVPGAFTYASSNTSVASISGSTVTVAGFGTSTITATFVPSSTTNYNSTTTSLVISVAKKSLRVTPDDKTKFFGASHPTITKSVIGLAGSEDIATISYTYEGIGSTSFAASTSNPVNAGTYSLTPLITGLTSGSLSNYDITYDVATFTINKISQSGLTIVSSSSATFGETLILNTSGGSGSGSVSFTKVSGDCTLNSSGSTYSITPGAAGNNCVVNATKAADINYNALTTTDQTITIGKATQTLTFTSTPSSSKVNDTYTPVVASRHSSTAASTAITPSITIDVTSSSVCTISGGVVTFDAAGSCVINADANSSTNYEVATTTSQTITVTIVITNPNANSNPSSSPRANSTPAPTPSARVRPNAQRPDVRNVAETPPNRPITPPVLINPPGLTNLPPVNSPELRPIFPSQTESVSPNSSNPGLPITDNFGRLPKSEPGEKQISVGGDFLPIQEFITPEGNTGFTIPESVNVAPIEVILKTTDIEGQNIPASDDGIMRAVKGQTITVSGEGLNPGSTYSAWLFSEPTKLGEGKVGADSKFEKVFFVPENIETGEHTLQINGINSDKKVVSLTTGVILTDVRVIKNVSESDGRAVDYATIFTFLSLLIIALLLRYIRKLKSKKIY
jgi:hypothetical protein